MSAEGVGVSSRLSHQTAPLCHPDRHLVQTVLLRAETSEELLLACPSAAIRLQFAYLLSTSLATMFRLETPEKARALAQQYLEHSLVPLFKESALRHWKHVSSFFKVLYDLALVGVRT